MNGSETYTIEPGMTAELKVGSYHFETLPATNETVEIGYEFEYSDGREEEYFAESMRLPKKFRDEIKRVVPENAR